MNRPKTKLNEVSIDPKAIKQARSLPIPQEQVDRSMHFLRSLALDIPMQTGGKIDTETRKVVESRSLEDMLEAQLEAQSRKLEEGPDAQDHVSLDIPLLIRLFELMKEGVKTDVELHKVVERILAMKSHGVLTMTDYEKIAGPNKEGQIPEPKDKDDDSLSSLKTLAGIK